MLRKAGDFKDATLVEYITLVVSLPNKYTPQRFRIKDVILPDDAPRDINVSVRGRLTNDDGCYIESIELAELFLKRVSEMFAKRSYKNVAKLRLEVKVTDRTEYATFWKERDSELIREFLSTP